MVENGKLTFGDLNGDALAVINFDLPTDATPQLLGDARDWCLTLIELLEQYRDARTEVDPDDAIASRLVDQYPDKVRRAQERLDEIDAALRALGYDPEACSFGKPPLQ